MSMTKAWVQSLIFTGFAFLGSFWFTLQILEETGRFWDVSRDSEYTLQVATQQLLSELDDPIEIIAFEAQPSRKDADLRDRYVVDLLKQLNRTASQVQWKLRNLDKDRELAQQLGITQYGMIAVSWKGKTVVIPERELFLQQMNSTELRFVGESIFQQALRTLIFPTVETAYTLEGNGERSLYDGSSKGLSDFHALLENKGLQVKKLNLLRQPTVPTDAALVLVLEPKESLSLQQQQALMDFIQRGGNVWFSSEKPHLEMQMPLQIQPLEGVVAETKTATNHWDQPILALNPIEPNIQLLQEDRTVVFGRTAGFELTAAAQSGIRQTSFVNLRPNAWIETNRTLENPVFDELQDWKGKASLVVGIELTSSSGQLTDEAENTRVIMMGDIDWVSNRMLEAVPSNALFAQVLLDWVMDETKGQITKYRTPTRILITKPQFSVLRLILLVPLPLIIAGCGLVAWRRRR